MKETIKQYLRNQILEHVPITEFSVEVPSNPEHGDYATNAAFLMAKANKQNPVELAFALCAKLKTTEIDAYAVGPFINFRLTDYFLSAKVMNMGDDYGKSDFGQNSKILLEYVSANPTGPLHIGHGRWAVLGDVLKRILLFSGFNAYSEFYINDAGNQVESLRRSVQAARNNETIPDDGYHGHYVLDLAEYNADPVEILLADQQRVCSLLRVSFDSWFREKLLHSSGAVTKAREYLDTYEKDGAVWLKTMVHGDDKDRVLIKATGETTYFAADIAYHHDKLERGFKTLINIWGADHHGYVVRMQGALKTELEKHNAKLKIIIGQLVNLFRSGEAVRMSKRTGDMICLEDVIEEIGVDATRYFLIRYSADTAIDFDLDLAKKESQDNPVYYVQYAHARICSIIRNAQEAGVVIEQALSGLISADLKESQFERKLAKKLLEFPDEVLDSAINYQPHRIALYAEELASVFHAFYHNCRVISEDSQLTKQRLVFVQKTKLVLEIILVKLLGITAPEKM